MSRIVRQGALYRYRYRRRCRQMGAACQEAILIGRVSDQDRSTVRSRVTVLTSNRLDLIWSNVLRLSCLRYGDTIFCVVAAIETNCSDMLRDTVYKEKKRLQFN